MRTGLWVKNKSNLLLQVKFIYIKPSLPESRHNMFFNQNTKIKNKNLIHFKRHFYNFNGGCYLLYVRRQLGGHQFNTGKIDLLLLRWVCGNTQTVP